MTDRRTDAGETMQFRVNRIAAVALLALLSPFVIVMRLMRALTGRRKPVYPHPIMEEVLGETWGVMVYQEGLMRILNRLGGIELSSAYACIKAISKKKAEIIPGFLNKLSAISARHINKMLIERITAGLYKK